MRGVVRRVAKWKNNRADVFNCRQDTQMQMAVIIVVLVLLLLVEIYKSYPHQTDEIGHFLLGV